MRPLAGAELESLEARFREGAMPAWEELEGDTLGQILGFAPDAGGIMRLLGRMTFDSAPSRWRGKRFLTPFAEGQEGSGLNLFDNRILSRRYKFTTRCAPSLLDGEPCLVIEYPPPSLVRGTRDELRRTARGVLLGRGYYRPAWKKEPAFLSYFALCPLESA